MHLHDVGVVEAGGAEQSPDVVEHRPRLGDEPARDRAMRPGRVADLAGEEHEAVRLDELGEWERAWLDAGQIRHGLGHGSYLLVPRV